MIGCGEVAFASVPMLGHLTPLLPYAAELLERGYTVTIFHDSHPKYRQAIEACGLAACQSVTYNNNGTADTSCGSLYDCVKSHYKTRTGTTTTTAHQRLLPAVLVHEFFAVDAADAADALGVPRVAVFPNPRSINPWAATVAQQKSLWWKGWCGVVMHGLESVLARILWCGRSWQRWKRGLSILPEQDIYPSPYMLHSMIGCYSPLLERSNRPEAPLFHAVGPSLPPQFDPVSSDLQTWLTTQRASNRWIIYIAFGTMYKYTAASVQQLEADLLELGDGVAVLWSLPQKYQSLLAQQQQLNKNDHHWKIASFLPQVALLQSGHVDMFVTHCGSNSVSEACLLGVPMVCCPGMADQPANAVRLTRAGVGVLARKLKVRAAIKELLSKLGNFTERSRQLATTLQSNNAAQQTAEIIEDLAHGRTNSAALVKRKRRLPLAGLLAVGLSAWLLLVSLL